MGATGTLQIRNVNSVEVTVSITMPIKSWRQLHETLKNTDFAGNDGWYLTHTVLHDLLNKADREIWSTASEPEAKP